MRRWLRSGRRHFRLLSPGRRRSERTLVLLPPNGSLLLQLRSAPCRWPSPVRQLGTESRTGFCPMVRYKLRTLLIVLAIVPPIAAWLSPRSAGPVPVATMRPGETAEVDLIQVHTNTNPAAAFQQVLFWSRYPDGDLHLREWRLLGKTKNNPRITHSFHAGCECRWLENGVECRVHAPAIKERQSTVDPELLARAKLPKNRRALFWLWPAAKPADVVSIPDTPDDAANVTLGSAQ